MSSNCHKNPETLQKNAKEPGDFAKKRRTLKTCPVTVTHYALISRIESSNCHRNPETLQKKSERTRRLCKKHERTRRLCKKNTKEPGDFAKKHERTRRLCKKSQKNPETLQKKQKNPETLKKKKRRLCKNLSTDETIPESM